MSILFLNIFLNQLLSFLTICITFIKYCFKFAKIYPKLFLKKHFRYIFEIFVNII